MSYQTVKWVQDYDVLKSHIRSRRQTGALSLPADVKELVTKADVLGKDLQVLQSAPMEHEISSSEIARRQVILENLKKQITLIPQNFVGNSARESFGIDPSRNSQQGSSNRPSNLETFNPLASSSATSTQALVQRQHEVIKYQDSVIVDISKGVDVIHQQALEINQEAKAHLQILGKLDTNVEKASDALRTEAEHAERVRTTSNVCYMYIIVVLEVVIIVALLIFMFAV